jgi:propionate catabolism operon transcriptional regulator
MAMERDMIVRALEDCGGNRMAAARQLGISSTTLWRRLKEMGLCP